MKCKTLRLLEHNILRDHGGSWKLTVAVEPVKLMHRCNFIIKVRLYYLEASTSVLGNPALTGNANFNRSGCPKCMLVHIYNLLTVLIYLQNVVVDHAWRSHKQLVSPKLQECLFIDSQFSSGENCPTYSRLVQLVVITYSLSTCTT